MGICCMTQGTQTRALQQKIIIIIIIIIFLFVELWSLWALLWLSYYLTLIINPYNKYFKIHFTDEASENQNWRTSPKFPFLRHGDDSNSCLITCELCIGKYFNLFTFHICWVIMVYLTISFWHKNLFKISYWASNFTMIK